MSHLFYSLINLIIAAFFIVLGVVCALLPWFEDVRTSIIHFMLENTLEISLFGLAFIAIGLGLIFHIIQGSRRRYYKIKSGENTVTLSETLVQDYLSSYWKDLFPQMEVPCHIQIKKRKIKVTADLPYVPVTEQKPLLTKIENDLMDLFRGVLGYRDPLDVSISFQSEPKK